MLCVVHECRWTASQGIAAELGAMCYVCMEYLREHTQLPIAGMGQDLC
jgi:hypothetical protein